MKILYTAGSRNSREMVSLSGAEAVRIDEEIPHDEQWELELPDGRIVTSETGRLPDPGEHLEFDLEDIEPEKLWNNIT